MSIPKEPRQMMINMMYLVLTAMLALNVSAEVLNAFTIVNDGIKRTNKAIESKNSSVYEAFEEKAKDDPRDPSLSEEGKARAEKLAEVLADQPVDVIYSTPFKRTRNTASPLAEMKGLSVQIYDFRSPNYLQSMMEKHRGGTILISGHSNTTPMIANLLIGAEKFQQLSEDEYGKIFIVSVTKIGQGKVTLVRY